MSGFLARWRFAFQRRWFTYLCMAIAFAIACGFLSHWQFGRNAQTVALNTLVTANYKAAPVAPATLLATKSFYSTDDQYRRVTMTGRYLTSKQILVRDRSLGPNPGFEVLTPFRETNGDTFVVDRGWVAIGTKHSYPDYIPPAPKGREVVTARLQGSETVLPGRVSPTGQIAEINVPSVAQMVHLTDAYTGAYGLLTSETPKPPSRPIAIPKPVIDNGPFLSYAFQWILFAIMGFGGLAWALRQEYRARNAEDSVEREHTAARAERASRRAPTDADIEDAEIADAAAAANRAATDRARREMIDAG
jgi:cytochrome oxidase assembly protein ShyY1